MQDEDAICLELFTNMHYIRTTRTVHSLHFIFFFVLQTQQLHPRVHRFPRANISFLSARPSNVFIAVCSREIFPS